ncbi:pheST operon leader peptide PheM [Pectobacterium versatile]|nr:pheST operon leader peptide PheM [Pectobacterium versatile]
MNAAISRFFFYFSA